MKILDIPYYKNPDNTHCYQATIKMVLKYFMPEKNFSWKDLEELTAKKNNLWTWPMQGLINLKKMGFEVINMEYFDYERFRKYPQKYLEEEYGESITREMIKHSDIQQEVRIAKNFLSIFGKQTKLPSIEDIKRFTNKGYLIICNVNSRSLNNKKGYVGHFVVISGYDNGCFYINNPDGKKNQKISLATFRKAWEYPNRKARNIQVFKLQN